MTTAHTEGSSILSRRTPRRAAMQAEAIKLWSLPTGRVLVPVAIAFAVVVAIFFYATLPVTQGRSLSEIAPGSIISVGILGVDASTFVVIVLAATFVGSEYATGLIQTTLTLTPARFRVLAGKLLVVGIAAAAVGVVAAILCTLIAVIASALAGVNAGSIFDAASVRLAVSSVAMPVLYGLLAACAAFVFRSTAWGIISPLAVMTIGGIIGWFGVGAEAVVTPLMPVSAIHSLAGTATGYEAIGLIGAALSLIAWPAVAAALAGWRLTRNDA